MRVGGHKAGEVASQFVTYELQNVLKMKTSLKSIRLNHGCVQTLKISTFICITMLENPDYHGMGTTLVRYCL